jgi:hypothetical protein
MLKRKHTAVVVSAPAVSAVRAPSGAPPSTAPSRPDRVSVTTGQVVNLGNYNSARVETGVETDVRVGEQVYDAQVRAFKSAEDFLAEAIDQIVQVAMPGLEAEAQTSAHRPRQKHESPSKPLKRLRR